MLRRSTTTGDFVQLMIGAQSRLYALIVTLVGGDPEQAADALQQTNLVMWQKADEFQLGTNFMAWAFQIARFQVMAQRQKLRRDRLVFDDETLAEVSEEFARRPEVVEGRLEALAHCLHQLHGAGRELLAQRYRDGLSVQQIAAALGHTANRVAVRLHRLRSALLDCIRQRELQETPA